MMNGFLSYLRSIYIVKRSFEEKNISIKVPQKTKREKNEVISQILPVVISIGTMVIFVVIYNLISSAIKGESGSLFGSMGMYFIFMIASVVSGIVTSRFQRKSREKEENENIEKWAKNLKNRESDILTEYQSRDEYMNKCFISSQDQLVSIVRSQSPYLWNVMEEHNDFLKESLGLSEVDSGIRVSVEGETDNLDESLVKRVRNLENSYRYLHDSAYCINLKETPCFGVFGQYSKDFIASFITRLCVRHGYDMLRCVLICNNDNCVNFSWMKWLPHIWDDVKCYRYILKDAKNTSYFANFEKLMEDETKKIEEGYYLPFYVFVIADDSYIYGEKIKKSILDLVSAKRAAVISLGERKQDIPSFCTAWIDATGSKLLLCDSKHPEGKEQSIKLSPMSELNAEKISRNLSKLMLLDSSLDTRIPTKIGFLDLLYKDGTFNRELSVEQNIISQWKKATIPSEMQCLCGAVEDSAVYKLRIDQIKHAILAGKTRSGKSQFLMAFIAYLMAHYPPSFVQFLFLDFKGAALSSNFSATPHCAGSFSDLDKGDASKIVRLREMLNAEISRRENLITNAHISVHDLEHYNLAINQSGSKNYIPHLFVVVDEYVELLSQHDEFIKDFERFSRVGASNGIHLFLASQRLDEKVTGQIKTNIDVSICFKVNDESESTSMIDLKAAKYIKHQGRGFIKTENEVREFQAPWIEKPFMPSNCESRQNIYTVDLDGKRGRLSANEEAKQGDKTELNVISEILNKYQTKTSQKVFSEEIGEEEYWTKSELALFERYRRNNASNDFLFGVSDDFYEHCHRPAKIALSGNNYFIVGAAKRGKTTFLQSVIYSACMSCSPRKINIYICDLGSRDFKPFTKFPQVHETVIDNIEQFFRLLAFVEKIIAERKRMFGDDYSSIAEYRISHPNDYIPEIIVMIDDVDNLIEDYEIVAEKIESLIVNSCERYGITFIVTAKRHGDIRRFSRMFDNKIAFYCQNGTAEDLMEMPKSVKLQDIPGRCLYENGNKILVTQVFAFPHEAGKTTKEIAETIIDQSMQQLPVDWLSDKPHQIVRKVEFPNINSVQKNNSSSTAIVPLFIDNTENIPVYLDEKFLNSIFVLGEYRNTASYLRTIVKAIAASGIHTFVIDISNEMNAADIASENIHLFDFDNISSFFEIYSSFGRINPDAPRVIITVGLTDFYEALTCRKQGVLDNLSDLLKEIYLSNGRVNQYWIASDTLQNIHFEMFSSMAFTIEMMSCGEVFKKNPRFIEIGAARDFSPYKPALIDIEYNNRELPQDQAWFGYKGSYRRVVIPTGE